MLVLFLVSRAVDLTPVETENLLLGPDERAGYEAGGSYAALFDPGSLSNRLPVLAWVLALLLIGLVGLPYVWLAASSLPDRGWAFARPVGLLLVAWLAWLAASFELASFSFGTLVAAVLVAGAGGAAIAYRYRDELLRWLLANRRLLLIEEAVFWALFAALLAVRWANPDLWHPFRGGEKPMDFAYLNAVIKSDHFPPFDPWFAGGHINYYYFGFVLVAALVELTAIAPAVAYNLAVPTLFAFLGLAAFGTTLALLPRRRVERLREAVAAGLLGTVFVVIVGNLGELRLLRRGFDDVAPDAWFWEPSRAIASASDPSPITEFPFFTFLFADLHAHAIALPYTLVTLGLIVALVRRSGPPSALEGGVAFGLLALALGSLWAVNPWDLPTYAALALIGFVLACPLSPAAIAGSALRWIVLVVAAYLLFLPFHEHYVSPFAGFELWMGSRTSLGDFLVVHGLFLFLIVAALLAELRFGLARPIRAFSAANVLAVLGLIGSLALAVAGEEVAGLIVLLMTLTARVFFERGTADLGRLTLVFVFAGLALALAVEYVVPSGIDIGRSNTVFKFYLQIWVLWGIASALAVVHVYRSLPSLRAPWRVVWRYGFVALLGAALLYPIFATRTRIDDRFDPSLGRSLDGMDFMRTAVYSIPEGDLRLGQDLDAIRWMQREVPGSPVIAEINTYPLLYGWGNRFSIYTGNPAIVGWDFHQRQQRPGAGEVVLRRVADVQLAYSTASAETARSIFSRYGVRYFVVGPLERAFSPPTGLRKWKAGEGSRWDVVYSNPGVTIYRVTR